MKINGRWSIVNDQWSMELFVPGAGVGKQATINRKQSTINNQGNRSSPGQRSIFITRLNGFRVTARDFNPGACGRPGLDLGFDDLAQKDGGVCALGQEEVESEALGVGFQSDVIEKEASVAAAALYAMASPLLRCDGAAFEDIVFKCGGIGLGLTHFVAEQRPGEGNLALVEAFLICRDIFYDEHAAGVGLFD